MIQAGYSQTAEVDGVGYVHAWDSRVRLTGDDMYKRAHLVDQAYKNAQKTVRPNLFLLVNVIALC